MHLGGWIDADNPNLAPLTLELITPSRWDERYSNTVLIAGLLDHIMNTLSEISVFEVMGGTAKVTSLTKAQCFAAREQWRALRADELAPAKLAELANYSDRD